MRTATIGLLLAATGCGERYLTYSIRGQLVREAGQPANGARVGHSVDGRSALEQLDLATVTADGRFEFEGGRLAPLIRTQLAAPEDVRIVVDDHESMFLGRFHLNWECHDERAVVACEADLGALEVPPPGSAAEP